MGGAAGHGRCIRGHCRCAVVRETVGGLRLADVISQTAVSDCYLRSILVVGACAVLKFVRQ